MNPEFQRNLYLEFSFARLVGMPAFLLVTFSLTYLIDGNTFYEVTANTAIGLYIAIVLLWGSKQAAECIFEELRNNTWDIQRTSAISPWSLTWGKLLGSTLFNWYGGLLCLLVYSLATPEPEYLVLTWIFSLTGGILAQSLSLLVSLFSLRRKQSFNSGYSYLFALFILFFIMPVILNVEDHHHDFINWYGEQYDMSYFSAISLIIVCIWTIIGIYRLISEELRIRSLPWVWFLFITYLIIYISGVIVADDKLQYQLLGINFILVGFAVCIFLSYISLFIDENNPMQLRKVWIYSEQDQWLKVLQQVPCWILSTVLALPMMLILMLLNPMEMIDDINIYPLVIYFLMLRDMGILLYFSYAPNPKRAMSLTLLYMICLYGLLPAIFQSINAEIISAVIFPLLASSHVSATFFAGFQTCLMGLLLYQRWRSRVANVINLNDEQY